MKNVKLELLGKLSPTEGVSGYMQVYKLVVDDKNLEYESEFQSLNWLKIDDVIKDIKNNPNKYKGDLLTVLIWYQSKNLMIQVMPI